MEEERLKTPRKTEWINSATASVRRCRGVPIVSFRSCGRIVDKSGVVCTVGIRFSLGLRAGVAIMVQASVAGGASGEGAVPA